MIYYKHYIGDFNRHTGHLSVAQDGAYRRLMDHYYSTECALPADKNSLYRICGAMEKYERAAVDFVCQQFFSECDGKLFHERVEEEIAIAQKKIEKLRANASAGGKQSGETRKEKAKANAEANASQNAEEDAQAKPNKVNSQSQSKANALEKTPAPLALPDWLSPDDWQRFVEYRRKASGKKFTAEAEKLNLSTLVKLVAAGNDPVAVLDQTIANGWSGLFEVKASARASPGGAWWATDQSIIAKGAEMGMQPRAGEPMQAFKGRVQAAIDNGGKEPPPPRQQIVTAADIDDRKGMKPVGLDLKALIRPRAEM